MKKLIQKEKQQLSATLQKHHQNLSRLYKILAILTLVALGIFYVVAPTPQDKGSVITLVGIATIMAGILYAAHKMDPPKEHE